MASMIAARSAPGPHPLLFTSHTGKREARGPLVWGATCWSGTSKISYGVIAFSLLTTINPRSQRRNQGRTRTHADRIDKSDACAAGDDEASNPDEPAAASESDGRSMLVELQRRAAHVKEQEGRYARCVASNWRQGRARALPIACVDDWVRRVVLQDDELFVGTASSGVQCFRLGEAAPRRRLRVAGDANKFVQADHQAGTDPETSVISLSWNGRWLAAGLACGHLHVWDADGAIAMDVPPTERRPCYVCFVDGDLVAVEGSILRRWELPRTGSTLPVGIGASRVSPATAHLPCRAHCLTHGRDGGVFVGLESGVVQLYDASVRLAQQYEVHEAPVSAALVVDDGFVTGSGTGEVVRWLIKDNTSPCPSIGSRWRADHAARVVSVAAGGGGAIVTAALDGHVCAWEADAGDLRFAIPGHKAWLGSVSVEADCGMMATDGRDNIVFLYDFRGEASVRR